MSYPVFAKSYPTRLLSRRQLQSVMDYLKEYYVLKKDLKRKEIPCTISELSEHTSICSKTLYNYIHNLKIDPSFNPKDKYELINRSMSEDLERKLAMFIDDT